MRVCISTPNTLTYPMGGHLWVFMNWAHGLEACGCRVTWLDFVDPATPTRAVERMKGTLRTVVPFEVRVDYLSESRSTGELAAGEHFDLLLDFRYNTPRRVLAHARRSAL